MRILCWLFSEYCDNAAEKDNDTKYILLWTSLKSKSFEKIVESIKTSQNCEFSNCHVAGKRNYFKDITEWDAIIFNGPDFTTTRNYAYGDIPKDRSRYQIYIYLSIDPASLNPVFDDGYNKFFNWTWTYRLDSRLIWSRVYILDDESNNIGPRADMTWLSRANASISYDVAYGLHMKTKAVALFCSYRVTEENQRVINELDEHLERRNLTVDIYTDCGSDDMSGYEKESCGDMLKETYFFYLSLEAYHDEDYVTFEFLTAMKNLAVPIVASAPHYANFAPPGSYIELKNYSLVADKIYSAMNNMTEYYEYFWWTDLYRYDSQADDHRHSPLCSLCKALNTPEMAEKETVVENLEKWWNGYLL